MPTEEKKSMLEWEKYYDTLILDADGFPLGTTRNTEFTKDEFLKYCNTSTIRFSQKLLEAYK